MKKVNASQARKQWAELLSQVADEGERVVVSRRGQDVAAFVSMEDFERLQALKEIEGKPATGGKSYTLDELVAGITPENRPSESW